MVLGRLFSVLCSVKDICINFWMLQGVYGEQNFRVLCLPLGVIHGNIDL